jgi:hypothetical protein
MNRTKPSPKPARPPVSRALIADLARLEQLAFRRKAKCGPLVEQFHRLKSQISRSPQPSLLWNIYDWLLVPLSLWPIDFEGLASNLLDALKKSNASNTSDPDSPTPIKNPKSQLKNTLALPMLPFSHEQLVIPGFPPADSEGINPGYELMLAAGYQCVVRALVPMDKGRSQGRNCLKIGATLSRIFSPTISDPRKNLPLPHRAVRHRFRPHIAGASKNGTRVCTQTLDLFSTPPPWQDIRKITLYEYQPGQ